MESVLRGGRRRGQGAGTTCVCGKPRRSRAAAADRVSAVARLPASLQGGCEVAAIALHRHCREFHPGSAGPGSGRSGRSARQRCRLTAGLRRRNQRFASHPFGYRSDARSPRQAAARDRLFRQLVDQQRFLLIGPTSAPAQRLADRADSGDAMCALTAELGWELVAPLTATRGKPCWPLSRAVHCARNGIERSVGRIKRPRGVACRYRNLDLV